MRDITWYDDSIYPIDTTNRTRYKRPDHLDIYCPNYEEFVYYPKEECGDYRYITEYPQYQHYNSVSHSRYQSLSNPYRKFYNNNRRNYYPNQYRDYQSEHKKPANQLHEAAIGKEKRKEKPIEKPNIAVDCEDANISDAETVHLDSGDEYDDSNKKLISNDLDLPEYSLPFAGKTKTDTLKSKATNEDSGLDKNKPEIKNCKFLSETKTQPTKALETEKFKNKMARRYETKRSPLNNELVIQKGGTGLRLTNVESKKCTNVEVPKAIGQTDIKYLVNKNPAILGSQGDDCQTKTAGDGTKLRETNVTSKKIEQTETTPSTYNNVILLNRNGCIKNHHNKKQNEITKSSEGKGVTKKPEVKERTPSTVSNGNDSHRKDCQTKKQNVEADRKSSKVKETPQKVGNQISTNADTRTVQCADAANKGTDKKIHQTNSRHSISNRDVDTIDSKNEKHANDQIAKLDGRRCGKSENNTKKKEAPIESDNTVDEEVSQYSTKKHSKTSRTKERSKSVCAIASNFVSYEDIKKMDNVMTSLVGNQDDELDALHEDDEICKIMCSPKSERKIPEPKPKSSRSRMRGKSCILFDRKERDTPHFSGAQSLESKDVLCFTDFRVTRSISKNWLLSGGLGDPQRRCRTPAVTQNKKPERLSSRRQTVNVCEVPVKKPSLFSEDINEVTPQKEWHVVPIELSFTPRYDDVEPVISYDSVTFGADNNRDPRRKGNRISLNGREHAEGNENGKIKTDMSKKIKQTAKEEGNKNGEIKTAMPKKICGRRKTVDHGCDSDSEFVPIKQSAKEGIKNCEIKIDMPKKICGRRKTIAAHGCDSDPDYVPIKQSTKERNKNDEIKAGMPKKIYDRRKTIAHGCDSDPDYVPPQQIEMPARLIAQKFSISCASTGESCVASDKRGSKNIRESLTDKSIKTKSVESTTRSSIVQKGSELDKKVNVRKRRKSTSEGVNSKVNSLITESAKDGEIKTGMAKKICSRRKTTAHGYCIDSNCVPQIVEIPSSLNVQTCSNNGAPSGELSVATDERASKNIREPPTDKSIKIKPAESTRRSSIVQKKLEPNEKRNAPKRRKSTERINSKVTKRDSLAKDMPLLINDPTQDDSIINIKTKKRYLIDANIKHYRTNVSEPSFQSKSVARLNIEMPQVCSASLFVEPPSALNSHKTGTTTTTSSTSIQVPNIPLSRPKAATTSVSEPVNSSNVSFSKQNSIPSKPKQVQASTSVLEKVPYSDVSFSSANVTTSMPNSDVALVRQNATTSKQGNNSSMSFSRPNDVNILKSSNLTPNHIMTMQAQLPQIFSDLATSLLMIRCLKQSQSTQIVIFHVLPVSDAVTNERKVFDVHYDERISCWSAKISTVCNKMHTDVLDIREFLKNLFVALKNVSPELSVAEFLKLMMIALADNYCTLTNYAGRLKLCVVEAMEKTNKSTRLDHLEKVVNNVSMNAISTSAETTDATPAVLHPGVASTSQNQTPVGTTVRQTLGNSQNHLRAPPSSTLPALLPTQIDLLKSQISAYTQIRNQASRISNVKPGTSKERKKRSKQCRDLPQIVQQLQQKHPSIDHMSNLGSFALSCLANYELRPNLIPKNVSCVDCPKPVHPPPNYAQSVSYLSNFLAPCSGLTNTTVVPLANLGQKEIPRCYPGIRNPPRNNIVYPALTNAIVSENNNSINTPATGVFMFGKTQTFPSQTKLPHVPVNKSGAVSHASRFRFANNSNVTTPTMNRSSSATNVQSVPTTGSHGSGVGFANNNNVTSTTMNRSSLAVNVQSLAATESHESGVRFANSNNVTSPVMNRTSLTAHVRSLAAADSHESVVKFANNVASSTMDRSALTANAVQNVSTAKSHGSEVELTNNDNVTSPAMESTSLIIDLTSEENGSSEFVDFENYYFNCNNTADFDGHAETNRSVIEETPIKRRKISDGVDDDPIPPRTSSIDSGLDSPDQIETISTYENRICLCGESAIYVCPCRQAMYCSRICQSVDWDAHRKNIAH